MLLHEKKKLAFFLWVSPTFRAPKTTELQRDASKSSHTLHATTVDSDVSAPASAFWYDGSRSPPSTAGTDVHRSGNGPPPNTTGE